MPHKINISLSKQKLIVYIFLILATLAVYGQVHQFDFVNIDDGVYVTLNSRVQSGMTPENLFWSFFTTYAEFWHPLTWLSLMFDYELYGLNAGGYHMTNLILHILSTLLLFRLFHRMTEALWPSAFVAAFFALHPLHVESVAWIAERKDVLSAFFWMLTLCLYVSYVENPTIKRYLLVLCGFVLALMSKPVVVTLPVIMILLDYWPLKRFESQKSNLFLWQLKEKAPFFVLSAVFSVAAYLAQYNPTAINYPLGSRINNALVSFVTYLAKTFWPRELAVFYPFPLQISVWQFFGAIMLILFISIMAVLMIKRLPFLFTGWMWYAITILPVIGIIQVGKQAMADRYTYLPLIGVGIMLAWGVPLLFKRENVRQKVVWPVGILFLSLLAFWTWQQCSYWKNGMELFNHTLRVTKNNYLAHNNLGLALVAEGKIEEAVAQYNAALDIKSLMPDHILVYNNRGIAYSRLGLYQKALDDLNQAIERKPDYADAYGNRGIVYSHLGQNRLAFEDFNKALQLNPDQADLYNNRGVVCAKLGFYRRAIEDFNEAIRLKPDDADAFYKRGVVYLEQGNKELGCRDAHRACELGNCGILKSAQDKGDCR
ncbi:MAG: tetratricopeptide repeat protein [Deltaproteobacteria bacterium]|nr:tetratricopeptide repeat protein [Deltaproteobacteria bacterium]